MLDWPLQLINKKDNTEKDSKTERERERESGREGKRQQTPSDLTTESMLSFMELRKRSQIKPGHLSG